MKYFVEHLRERCTTRLLLDWPSTLSSWDSRELEAIDRNGRYNPRTRFPHPILVIKFAREVGLTEVLPSAFYDLCRYGPSKIVSGIPQHLVASRRDPCWPGTTAGGSSSPSESERENQLSHSDLRIALSGRETAQRVVANFIEEELSARNVADDCHNKDREGGRVCRESFYFIMLNLLRSVGGIACGRDCDPLYTLTQAVEMMSRNDFSDGVQFCSLKICAACKIDFSNAVKAAREHVWTQIPSWFGMESYSRK